MWLDWAEGARLLLAGPGASGLAAAGCVCVVLWQHQRRRGDRQRAHRVQSELMAYMLLDDWMVQDARGMGRRICRTVSRHSALGRGAALLVRSSAGRLDVVASQRSDDLTVRALERWAEAEEVRERHRREEASQQMCPGRRPAAELVRLERRAGYRPGDPAALAWCTALIVPMCDRRGRVTGAIAVCADSLLRKPKLMLQDALSSLEALTDRFAEGVAGLREEGGAVVEQPVRAAAHVVARDKTLLPELTQA